MTANCELIDWFIFSRWLIGCWLVVCWLLIDWFSIAICLVVNWLAVNWLAVNSNHLLLLVVAKLNRWFGIVCWRKHNTRQPFRWSNPNEQVPWEFLVSNGCGWEDTLRKLGYWDSQWNGPYFHHGVYDRPISQALLHWKSTLYLIWSCLIIFKWK